MSTNAFERILGRLSEADGVTEKTASTEVIPSSEEVMLATVRKVAEGTKTAAATGTSNPATSLETMAKNAADHEEILLVKQAETLGATMCDSFFERFAAYDTALNAQGVKTAAPAGNLDAARLDGYKQAEADLEKQATESFETGYEDTIKAVYKTAAEIHYQGQQVAHELIQENAS